jgi:hypothetical protein
MEATHDTAASGSRRGTRAKRIVLATLIALASLNIWTGGPLFALWVGSRVQGGGPPTMGAVFVVAIVLAVVVLALVRLIAVLQKAYDDCTGRGPTVRAHTPWLRSMRGERPVYPGENAQLTAPERLLVIMAVLAVAALEVWFFFYSGSPIDQRSGRGAVPASFAGAPLYAAPPAIAGRMTTVSPTPTPVSRPCCTRTSSSLT